MWSLLPRKLQLTVIVGCSVMGAWGVEALVTWATGHALGPWKFISLIVTVIGVVMVGAINFVWFRFAVRSAWLQRKTFPDLNGTWKGTLVSSWVNPATGLALDPIPTEIIIRQTLLTTHVSLKTGESRSESTRAFLEPAYDVGRYRLWYSYNNDPAAWVRHRSTEHEGVAFLDMYWDEDRNRLKGRYYTARPTTGDIEVVRVRLPKVSKRPNRA